MKPTLRLPFAALAAVLAGCATSAAAAATATATASVKGSATDEETSSLARMLAGESAVQGAALDETIAKATAIRSAAWKTRCARDAGGPARLSRAAALPRRAAPGYERPGSGGDGPYGNVIDYYAVACRGAEAVTVIMDMYHAGMSRTAPVPGFTIVAP